MVLETDQIEDGQRLIYHQPPWHKTVSVDLRQVIVNRIVAWDESNSTTYAHTKIVIECMCIMIKSELIYFKVFAVHTDRRTRKAAIVPCDRKKDGMPNLWIIIR